MQIRQSTDDCDFSSRYDPITNQFIICIDGDVVMDIFRDNYKVTSLEFVLEKEEISNGAGMVLA